MNWNDAQQRAIDTRNCNILVSAGAGSGKTAVLTQRIVELVEEGTSITDMAICTFTEDATLEMKNRIREKLAETGNQDQAEQVYMADISTIHSLCKRIVADNFDVIEGLPPKFRILSNEALYEERALKETLTELFGEDNGFKDFVLRFSPNDDERIKKMILDTYHFICNIPDFDMATAIPAPKDIKERYCRLKIKGSKDLIEEYENLRKKLTVSLDNDRETVAKYQGDALYDELESKIVVAEKEIGVIDEDIFLIKSFVMGLEKGIIADNIKFPTMVRKAPNKELTEPYRKRAKDYIKSAIAFGADVDNAELTDKMSADIKQLLSAVECFDKCFSKLKMESNYLTFNDLEKYAYKILCNDEVAKEYQKRYRYIFVDEYQDTSKLQQRIIERISREDNVFMVGDIKQSIYGFRNADPSMFHRLYKEYEQAEREDENSNKKCIELSYNYRSDGEILDFVNELFSRLLNFDEEYYPPSAKLKVGRITTKDRENKSGVWVDLIYGEDKELSEARHIVKRIEECVKEGYAYKDIAVLFRSVKTATPAHLIRLLQEKGIPADMSAGRDEMYMETRILLNLLTVIDNCNNDIPLLSVMYSDLYNFSISDLVAIKAMPTEYYVAIEDENGNFKTVKKTKTSFYDYARHYGDEDEQVVLAREKGNYEGSDDLRQRLDGFFAELEYFLKKSRSVTVSELISSLLAHTGYLSKVECTKEGRAKVSQIYQFISSADSFEAMGNYGLSGFLEYITSLRELKKAPELSGFVQSSDAVSIMTMHKSKGLEFKVVIVGELNKKMYHTSEESYYAFNKNIGVGLSYVDKKRKAKTDTPLLSVIKEQNTKDTFEEQMRMLYVAMTRPMERLYVVSALSADDELTGSLEMSKEEERADILKDYLEKYLDNCNMDASLLLGGATYLKAVLGALKKTDIDSICTLSLSTAKDEMIDENASVIEPIYNQELEQLLMESKDIIYRGENPIPPIAAVTAITEKQEEDGKTDKVYYGKADTKSSNGALAGTVTHHLLYLVDIDRKETVKELIERVKDGEYFTDAELELINEEMIECFLNSSICQRMREAKNVYREKAFIFELTADSGFTDERVMVQGIIDCLIEEEDGFVLVDYKTDNIVKNAEKLLKEKYSKQLELYSLAIEKLTGKKVKERIIFHLRTGKEFTLD